MPGEVNLNWDEHEDVTIRYNIYRAAVGSDDFVKVNDKPLGAADYRDTGLDGQAGYRYVVRSVNRKGIESAATDEIIGQAMPERREAVFVVDFEDGVKGLLLDQATEATLAANAAGAGGVLDLTKGGHVSFPYSSQFDLTGKLTLECRVRLDSIDQMPVIVSCGRWNDRGWFLQKLGGVFRWHVGGVDCDGGNPVADQWMHLICVYDGQSARLYQDGKQVGSVSCSPNQAPWDGPLVVGQYSGGVAEPYQVKGAISDVRIYRRAIGANEALEKFAALK